MGQRPKQEATATMQAKPVLPYHGEGDGGDRIFFLFPGVGSAMSHGKNPGGQGFKGGDFSQKNTTRP